MVHELCAQIEDAWVESPKPPDPSSKYLNALHVRIHISAEREVNTHIVHVRIAIHISIDVTFPRSHSCALKSSRPLRSTIDEKGSKSSSLMTIYLSFAGLAASKCSLSSL